MPNPDTEEWKISAYLEYVPKNPSETVCCDSCNGSGEIRGGFGWIGDPEVCSKCWGSGYVTKTIHPKEPKPEIPQDLIDYMRKAYLEYKLK